MAIGPQWASIIEIILAVLVGCVLSHYVTKVLQKLLRSSSVGELSIVTNIARAAVGIMVVYYIGENVFDVKLDGVAQALGITTLIVTFGLQGLIKNAFSGLEVVSSRLLSVGDHIEMDNVRGEVIDVSWRQVTLRDQDGNHYVIPNSLVTSSSYRYLLGDTSDRYLLECDIKPGLDLDLVASDIERLADEALDDRGYRGKKHTEVRFVGSTANGVKASVRLYLKDIEYSTKSKDAVLRAISQRGYLADWTNESEGHHQWR